MALESVAGKALVIDVGIWWRASHFKEQRTAVAAVYSAAEVIGRRLEMVEDGGVRLVRNGSRQDFFGDRSRAESMRQARARRVKRLDDGGDEATAWRGCRNGLSAALARYRLSADAQACERWAQTCHIVRKTGRGDWIRTSDPLRPRQAGERCKSANFRMICSIWKFVGPNMGPPDRRCLVARGQR
jgi:hypothetical protein